MGLPQGLESVRFGRAFTRCFRGHASRCCGECVFVDSACRGEVVSDLGCFGCDWAASTIVYVARGVDGFGYLHPNTVGPRRAPGHDGVGPVFSDRRCVESHPANLDSTGCVADACGGVHRGEFGFLRGFLVGTVADCFGGRGGCRQDGDSLPESIWALWGFLVRRLYLRFPHSAGRDPVDWA